MKPRSRRYFAIKRFRRYLLQTGSNVRVMTEWSKPIPKYPSGTHPGGLAMIGGEPGPERIFPRIELPTGTRVLPESLFKEGTFDVNITNAFTRHAKATIKKVDHDRPGKI